MTEITKEQYMEQVRGMKPISSFSDSDGTSPLSNQSPKMETWWGIDGTEILYCEMTKANRHQQSWDYKYYQL